MMPRPVVLISLLGVAGVELACLAGLPLPCALQMFLLTLFTLVLGCEAGLGVAAGDREKALTLGDAAGLPLVAGTLLVGLYLAFKHLDARLVNALLRAYFTAFGAFAGGAALQPLAARCLDNAAPLLVLPLDRLQLAKKGLPVTLAGLAAGAAGAAVAAWWCATSHWLASNLLGLAFCVVGLASMNAGNIKASTMALVGLFVYDIFMVFGTGYLLGSHKVSIMEEVATRVEGPIKLLFPLPPEEARGRASPYSMLGLGDIIVPGIHLALLLRFDGALRAEARGAAAAAEEEADAPTPYFNAGLLAYALGIIATNVSMHTMNTAQPALLFLVPAVLALPAGLALARGQLLRLWNFEEQQEAEGGQAAAADRGLAVWALDSLGLLGAAEALGVVPRAQAPAAAAAAAGKED
jgi:minor histocompatibility antigen H13